MICLHLRIRIPPIFYYMFVYIFRPIAEVDSEEHADVIFLVGEEPDVQRIPAHSWVLADNSPVFRAMFRGPLASGTASPNNSNTKRRRHSSATSDQDDLKYVASSLSVIENNEDKILEENEVNEVKEENGKGKKQARKSFFKL